MKMMSSRWINCSQVCLPKVGNCKKEYPPGEGGVRRRERETEAQQQTLTGQRRGLEDHTYGMCLTRKGLYLYHPSLKVGRLQFLFFQVNNNLTLLSASLIRLYDNNIKLCPGTFFYTSKTIHFKLWKIESASYDLLWFGPAAKMTLKFRMCATLLFATNSHENKTYLRL